MLARCSRAALPRVRFCAATAAPNQRYRPLVAKCFASSCAETVAPVAELKKKYDYWRKLGFIYMIRNPENHKDLFYGPTLPTTASLWCMTPSPRPNNTS